jgi:hypothetical protein
VPLFVQQTVSPWLMVGLEGVKEYSAIVITVSPALQPPAGRAWPEEAKLAVGRTTIKANNASVEIPLPTIAATILPSRARFQDPRAGTSEPVPNLMT